MPKDWTRREVELVVADYIEMLLLELAGVEYNKSATRRALLEKLDSRSKGSVERKRMNISAALIDAGLPSIDGYKPLSNYQSLLLEVVDQQVASDPRIKDTLDRDATKLIEIPTVKDILSALESPPQRSKYESSIVSEAKPRSSPLGLNYLEIDAANALLGAAGEEFCLRFEKARLVYEGAENLIDGIEQVSETIGPTAGYDIRSYERNGSDRFVEVKTTKYGRRTPFYISPNEVQFSADSERNYRLYRLHTFERSPHLFMLPGSVASTCELLPSQFKAIVR